MLPRVEEFCLMLEAHGLCADAVVCLVCKSRGRGSLITCFAEDAIAGGGKLHLKSLWAAVLSAGPRLWQEARVPCGAVRYDYVSGTVELCRGDPPALSDDPAAAGSASAEATSHSPTRRRQKLAPSELPGAPPKAAASRGAAVGVAAAGATPTEVVESAAGAGEGSEERATGRAVKRVALQAAEAEDSEHEERVVIEARPHGLDIGSVRDGRGAVVRNVEGNAAAAGVELGSQILSINDESVEDLQTSEIQKMLDREKGTITLDLKLPFTLPGVVKRKSRKKDPVTISTAKCRGSYRAVSEAIQRLGWQELQSDSGAVSVVWSEHADPTEGLSPVQTVSRIDPFLSLCQKARLAQCLNPWVDQLPEEFAFVPNTWVLPWDAADLKVAMTREKEQTYICKPTSGAQGKGITLARKWKDLENVVNRCRTALECSANTKRAPMEYVVQRYVAQPMLVDGFKFDMRLYAVVTSVVPLTAYLFKEGLARFCTVAYQAPQDSNLRDAKMHLTNYAVNKKSAQFKATESLASHDEGSKRSASAVFGQIAATHGVSSTELWSRVAHLAANTLAALRPCLVEWYVHEKARPLHPLGPKSFQIIGLDVLFDSNLQPRLLEINANSSLSVLQPGGSAEPEADGSSPEPGDSALPSGSGAEASAAAASSSASLASPPLSQSPAAASSSTSTSAPPLAHSVSAATLRHASSSGVGGETRSRGRLSMSIPARDLRGSFGVATRASSDPQGFRSLGVQSLPVVSMTRRRPESAKRSGRLGGSIRKLYNHRPGAGSRRGSEEGGDVGGSRGRMASQSGGGSSSSTSPPPQVTSELDLEIKRELISQALMVSRPAPQNKTVRLKKLWEKDPRVEDLVPLDDNGAWVLPGKQMRACAVRGDAPDRCPALETLDFEALAAPEVMEYAKAHLALYRCWVRSCGQGKGTLGQAQMLRLMERVSMVGHGCVFADRIGAQLWVSRMWRDIAPGSFGVNLPQFVTMASKLGRMLNGIPDAEKEGGPDWQTQREGLVEFVFRLAAAGESVPEAAGPPAAAAPAAAARSSGPKGKRAGRSG